MTSEQRETAMAEEIWLRYFNRYLLNHKTISLKEYLRMEEKIAIRCGRRRKHARLGYTYSN